MTYASSTINFIRRVGIHPEILNVFCKINVFSIKSRYPVTDFFMQKSSASPDIDLKEILVLSTAHLISKHIHHMFYDEVSFL